MTIKHLQNRFLRKNAPKNTVFRPFFHILPKNGHSRPFSTPAFCSRNPHSSRPQKNILPHNNPPHIRFQTANKEKEGVVETESGLQYIIEEEGTGIAPAATDTVEVNYEGRLLDGTVFDSSYERGESIKFPLNGVIKGWGEGLTYVKEGGKIRLFIPSSLAYGERATGPIPANSTLIFDVELIKVFKSE